MNPKYNQPALIDYISRVDAVIAAYQMKRLRLESQWKQATGEKVITCICGQRRGLVMAYRCLTCGEWFCHACAEVHFR